MIKGKTTSGFAFTLDDGVLDDWEILEALNDIDEGDSTKVVAVLKHLLSDDQYKALKDHLRGENKRVKVTDMVAALQDILSASNKTKNS